MTINLNIPDIRELKPRITVFGVGGAGGNAVNNMITAGLQGVDFVVANTDAQALTMSKAERIIQMGVQVTEGLGAGSQPEVGRAAAEEVIDEIRDHLSGAHMVFVTAGMGGGTGTGAAPVIAKAARELGILTVGVVTKPFHFEGQRRMRIAEGGIIELQKCVDTLLIIPNQNLFRVANEKTTFADAFAMADQVLYSGVACITDLMVKEGLINLDFADVRAVMREMGKAMMGTGEADGDKRALTAAEAAISNPLIDDASMKGARGLLDLHHRRPRPHALRGRRGGNPHPRGGRPGRQHHRRRDLRRKPRRHHPGVGGGDRHRSGRWRSGPRRAVAAAEPRIAEIAQRHARRQPAHRRADRAAPSRRGPAAAARSRTGPAPPPAPHRIGSVNASIESAAKAAIAAAVEDVTIRPLRPSPRCSSTRPRASRKRRRTPAAFIPPQPERTPARAPRMPRIDELPVPAQNEIRARRGELPQEEHPGEAAHVAVAAAGLGRPRPPRGRRKSRLPSPRPAAGSAPLPPPSGSPGVRRCRRPAEAAPGAGIRICQAPGAAGARPARPAGSCA